MVPAVPTDPGEIAPPGFSIRDLESSERIAVTVVLNTPVSSHVELEAREAGRPWTSEVSKAAELRIRATQDSVLGSIQKAGINYEMPVGEQTGPLGTHVAKEQRLVYLISAVRLLVPGRQIEDLLSVRGVLSVHDDRPRRYLSLNNSVSYTEAPQIWAPPPSGFGVKGAGKIVAVIDSGVDWNHPMFGDGTLLPGTAPLPAGPGERCNSSPRPADCLGKNTKVIYATQMGSTSTIDTTGHGTHVASTAAGTTAAGSIDQPSPRGRLDGVAPDALLMSWNVCPLVACNNFGVLSAIDDAAQSTEDHPRADVINMSLGAGSNNPQSPFSVAADNAARIGVSVVAANGNDGPGKATAGTPASGRLVIGVGNGSHPGNGVKISVHPVGPEYAASYALVLAGDNRLESPIQQSFVRCNGADTPQDCGPNASGKIALITLADARVSRGTYEQRKQNALAAGVIAVVFAGTKSPSQSGDESFPGAMATAEVPVIGITHNIGEALKSIGFDAGQVSVKQIRLESAPGHEFQDAVAGTSSRGPLSDLSIKPDLIAPGTNVYAATSLICVPVAVCSSSDGYISISGTSMASPHVAGAAALLRQIRPEWSVRDVKTALMNSASFFGPVTNSVMSQGAGHSRLHAAVTTPGLLFPPSVSFGEVVTPKNTSRTSWRRFRLSDSRIVKSGTQTYNLTFINRQRLPQAGFDASFRSLSNPDNAITQITVPQSGSAEFLLRVEVTPQLPESPMDDPSNDIIDPALGIVVDNPDADNAFEGYEFYVSAARQGGPEILSVPGFYRHVHQGAKARPDSPRLQDPGEKSTSGSYALRWDPVDSAEKYQVEESTNYTQIFPTDTAEGATDPTRGSAFGSNQGWTVGKQNHTPSGSSAFFSGKDPLQKRVLRTKELKGATSIEFWELLDAEPDIDLARVVANVGADRQVLRETSGYHADWRIVRLDLPPGTTSLEFEFESDPLFGTLLGPLQFGTGWWVDDVVITSASWKKLTDTPSTHEPISARVAGTYFYRVAGLFTGEGAVDRGEYSNTESIEVLGRGLAATGPGPMILLGLLLLMAGLVCLKWLRGSAASS